MSALPTGAEPAVTPRRPTSRVDLAPVSWIVWAGVAFWCLGTVASVWTPACVLAAGALLWWTGGHERRGLGAPVLTTGLLVLAAWTVVTVAVGPGDGGDVVWVLPEWAPASGAPVGGPVTTGRLTSGTQQALAALAHLTLVAVLLRRVDPEPAARAADVSLGRMAPLVHPWCFLGNEAARLERERSDSGLRGRRRLATSLLELTSAVAARSDDWRRAHPVPEGPLASRVRLVLLLSVGVLVLVAAVAGTVEGPTAALLALAGVAVASLAATRARPGLRHPADLAPLVCAGVSLALAWLDLPGDVVALSLCVLPLADLVLAPSGTQEGR